eukprot:Protomagalhaensia_sp_Gyna_25__660@NODE_1309_length_1957_cov_50_867049_g871_i2_p1_GENE_NODE_1309_length_1957_cov_50_867049_g871_i2NODE_1309_length_1957_cov_50_867049_g871_i2_p1_ORF_typecomplete_len265_score16_67_NODE_1309_length_1957_cov_50_867049_g871_i22751069
MIQRCVALHGMTEKNRANQLWWQAAQQALNYVLVCRRIGRGASEMKWARAWQEILGRVEKRGDKVKAELRLNATEWFSALEKAQNCHRLQYFGLGKSPKRSLVLLHWALASRAAGCWKPVGEGPDPQLVQAHYHPVRVGIVNRSSWAKNTLQLPDMNGLTLLICHDNNTGYRIASTRSGVNFLTCAITDEQGKELVKLVKPGEDKAGEDKAGEDKAEASISHEAINQFYAYLDRDLLVVPREDLRILWDKLKPSSTDFPTTYRE